MENGNCGLLYFFLSHPTNLASYVFEAILLDSHAFRILMLDMIIDLITMKISSFSLIVLIKESPWSNIHIAALADLTLEFALSFFHPSLLTYMCF